MSEKPAMLALEDELAAYFARAGFMAVEIDDLPDGSAIPWLPPIDLEELDPARAAKGSGQIAIVTGDTDTGVDARVAAIVIPRLTTAEIDALRLHTIPSAADLDIDLEFDLTAADVVEIDAIPLSDEAKAVLAEAWGGPATQLAREAAIPPAAGIERRVSIPPLAPPHATVDIKVAARAVVAQRLERVDLPGIDGEPTSMPWLAPVVISDSSTDELSLSVIIYDAQLEVPV